MTEASPPEGLFAGRFQLGALLGSGGSASVFEAVDVSTGALVAVKILHPRLSRSPSARAEFLAVGRAAAPLRHPNIAAVVDLGVAEAGEDDRAWIAMERARGVSLAERVERAGPLDPASAVEVAIAILSGLEAAHVSGVIHGDVTPANVLVDADVDGVVGRAAVKLVDFGLHESETGVVLGSVNYLAPERARGEAADERGDLYQTAGVLYFAITGEPPFVRSSTEVVLRAHAVSPPPVPSAARPGVGRGLDRVVARGLLKDPAARFDSAGMMREELEALSRSSDRALPRTVRLPSRAAAWPMPVPRPPRPAAPAGIVDLSPDHGTKAEVPQADGGSRGAVAAVVGGLLLTAVVVIGGWAMASARVPVPTIAPLPPSASAAPTAPPIEADAPGAPPRSATMPVVDLLSLAEARAVIEGSGLTVGALTVEDSARAGDTVLGSSVPAGAPATRGTAVDLRVASGSNLIPPTAGESSDEAIAAVQAAGFAVLVTRTRTYAVGADRVLFTDPAAGTLMRLGTTVTITVASPLVAPSPSPSERPGASASPSPSPSPSPTPSP